MMSKRFEVIMKCERLDKSNQRCEYYVKINGIERPIKDILEENEQLKKQYAYVCQKLAEPIDLANLTYKDLVGLPTITRKELFDDE